MVPLRRSTRGGCDHAGGCGAARRLCGPEGPASRRRGGRASRRQCGAPRGDVMRCGTPRGVWRSRLAAWGGLRPAASIARSGGKFQYAGGDRDGYNGWRQLPLQAPCSIPLGGLRQRRAAVRERLPGDPGWLQKPGLLVRNGLWVASEGMVRESTVDTPTVFLSRIALSPIGPSRVGCIVWQEPTRAAPYPP